MTAPQTELDMFTPPESKDQRRGHSQTPWIQKPAVGAAPSLRWIVAEWIHQQVEARTADWLPHGLGIGSRELMYEATRDPNLINPKTGKRFTKEELTKPSGPVNWNRTIGDLRRLHGRGHPLGIPFSALKDGRTVTASTGDGWEGPDELAASTVAMIEQAEWSRFDGQPHVVRVFVEAKDEMDVVAASVRDLPVLWASGSGYVPVKPKYTLASQALDEYANTGRLTVVGHIGDFDVDGVTQFTNLRDDVLQFVEDMNPHVDRSEVIRFERIMLTPEQVNDLIPGESRDPVEQAMKKAKWWQPGWGGETEYEALPAHDRQQILMAWLDQWLDFNEISRCRHRGDDLRVEAANLVAAHYSDGG